MKNIVTILTWDDIINYTSKDYFIIGIQKLPNEIFKRLLYNNIPHPDYLISNYGRVYSCRTNIFLKVQNTPDDYEQIKTSENGVPFWIRIHRAVMCTFCPIINPYAYTVDHYDGNHHNNYIGNLRWLTAIDNVKEGYRMGYINNRGDNNPLSIFTEKEVHKICQLLEQKMTYNEILEELNVDKNKDIKLLKKAIYSIMCRATYTYISEYYNFERYDMTSYSYKNKVDTICRLLSEGKSKEEICSIFNIPNEDKNSFKSYLSGLLRGKYFKDISIKYNLIDESKAIFTNKQVNCICKGIVDKLDNRSICISLGIDFDNLEHHKKSNLTREINKIRNKVIYVYISDNYF